jgi:hypothetical protein
VFDEITRYGRATSRRAYGDWTTSNLSGWRDQLTKFAIQPVQQFRYTVGKNSTDCALIIDAMDLLHSNRFDGFCIVSSDSDFTRLATRIRESGLLVYGFGERKTPGSLVSACDKFVYVEILRGDAEAKEDAEAAPDGLEAVFRLAIEDTAQDDGGAVGAALQRRRADFDARNYGFRKLSHLVRAQDFLEYKDVPSNDGSPSTRTFVRVRRS